MYAVTFDLDTDLLCGLYAGPAWTHAYYDLRREMEARGFHREQGTIYIGNDGVGPKDCIRAVMDLDAMFPWFKSSVRDIRMMRIAEEATLMDFLGYEAAKPTPRGSRK